MLKFVILICAVFGIPTSAKTVNDPVKIQNIALPANLENAVKELCEMPSKAVNLTHDNNYCKKYYNSKPIEPETAVENQFTFMVMIMFNLTEKVGHCPGTLITPIDILTQSDCIKRYTHGPMIASTGSTEECSNNRQNRAVSKFHAGKQIAIVEVAEAFKIDDFTNVIKMPEEQSYDAGLEFTIIGWGVFGSEHKKDRLWHTQLKVTDSKDCERDTRFNKDTTFCSTGVDGHTSIFGGNFGGPAIILDKNNEPVLIGINKEIFKDCGRVIWQLTNKILLYKDWINQHE